MLCMNHHKRFRKCLEGLTGAWQNPHSDGWQVGTGTLNVAPVPSLASGSPELWVKAESSVQKAKEPQRRVVVQRGPELSEREKKRGHSRPLQAS